ncbi:hypothetical protein ACLOJK_022462 [Asimina triloba]
MEMQKKLHEQIEVQRHLQLRIEAQGKYLQSTLVFRNKRRDGWQWHVTFSLIDHSPQNAPWIANGICIIPSVERSKTSLSDEAITLSDDICVDQPQRKRPLPEKSTSQSKNADPQSTSTLERVRQIKTRLVVLSGRVQKIGFYVRGMPSSSLIACVRRVSFFQLIGLPFEASRTGRVNIVGLITLLRSRMAISECVFGFRGVVFPGWSEFCSWRIDHSALAGKRRSIDNLPKPRHFSKGLYTFDIGQNDLSVAMSMSNVRVLAAIPDIINQLFHAVQQLYLLGARTFWIHNTGPLGCLPLSVIFCKGCDLQEIGCVKPQNDIASEFNRQLKDKKQGHYHVNCGEKAIVNGTVLYGRSHKFVGSFTNLPHICSETDGDGKAMKLKTSLKLGLTDLLEEIGADGDEDIEG